MSELDFTDLPDLASERLGGSVLAASDDFFAAKENLIRPNAPVFLEHEYTDRGKWMDGWESRRKRVVGFDWAILRLGLQGRVRGVVVDTAFFRGNYPEHCSIEGATLPASASLAELEAAPWTELLPKSALRGDSKNLFAIASRATFTHLRLNIFPDGGVARLRVHGEAIPDWRALGRLGRELDLAAMENGAKVLSCSDMFFGVRHNLILPGRAKNMGEGWETKRRRGPGYDWAVLELATEGELARVEIDTNHFKGNYPDTAMLEGARVAPGASLDGAAWVEVLARTKLEAHTRHHYEDELLARGPFTHLRLNIYPDGGVSRLRVNGHATREGVARRRLERLNDLPAGDATAELLACCGSTAWVRAMIAARPFADVDALLSKAGAVWEALEPKDWLEAFKAHPRIGEKKAEVATGARAAEWAKGEQSGAKEASHETLAALREENARYETKHGFVFIVFATGKSADEMLQILRARVGSSTDRELGVAAEEQRKITALRLEKLLAS